LARLNSFAPDDCIGGFSKLTPQEQLLVGIEPDQCVGMQQVPYRELAMFLWAMKVKTGADWNHKGTLKNSRRLCRTRKPRYVRVRNSVIIKAFEKRDL